MTRRRKDPFAGKENVRHFRLVHRPLGEEISLENGASDKPLTFDDLFEEYSPSGGSRHFRGQEILESEEFYEDPDMGEEESYDFANDDDGEMVDIDAELDQFAEEFIDIEGEDGLDRVKMAQVSEEKIGEAAKYGILLDDREYDYTRHLRKVGVTPGAVFIQAPGMKKTEVEKKPARVDFFSSEKEAVKEEEEQANFEEQEPSEEVLKVNHEMARQQYRALLQQVSDDPVLREVIEALEDDRYVTEEVDDQLVISLDNLNIKSDKDDFEDDGYFFDEEVDILGDDGEFPDFIPSEALKRQMEKIAAHEEAMERDELDEILDEYEDEDEESGNNRFYPTNDFIDIEGESEIDLVAEEEAAEIYKYLRENGRARGTTLYDKKRPDHLPPIHIAIAQYNELRRELAVNNDLIIQKYAEEDEEEAQRQIRESEKIIEGMVKVIDDPEEMEKRLNIETAKYLLKLSDSVTAGPRKIVETTKIPKNKHESSSEESEESESEGEGERINKGVARSATETAEEKKARKAKIKAEKREKRAAKSEKKNRK